MNQLLRSIFPCNKPLSCGQAKHPRKALSPLSGVRPLWRQAMEAGDASPTSELLAPPPPPESVKRRGKRARDGLMLFGAQLIKHEAKDGEVVEAAAPQGEEAIVPSESPEKQPPPAAFQVDKAKLYCSLCACSLTPPIYQVGFLISAVYPHLRTEQFRFLMVLGCRRLLFVCSARWVTWLAAAAA